MRDRIAGEGVGAVADDQQVGREAGDRASAVVERRQIGGQVGAARQRQVERRALAVALAGLVGMAPEERIVGRRIGVDRGEEDVAALVENVLGAVAVMIVDVEDRDRAVPAATRRLGGDRGIVEVAIAAEIIAPGMMAGRAAQGEGGALAGRARRRAR